MQDSSAPVRKNFTLWDAWRGLPRAVRLFVACSSVLWLSAIVAELFSRLVLHLNFPYNSFLLNERFPDLVDIRPRFTHVHTMAFFTDTVDAPLMYPAPIVLPYSFFYLFKPFDLPVFLLFCLFAFGTGAFLLFRALCGRGYSRASALFLCLFALCTSYPLFFLARQANQEIFVWCLIAGGLLCFFKGSSKIAAVCFGVAMATKIFPFVYLALFLAQRKLREIVIAVVAAVAVTLPSLYVMYPNIPVAWKLNNIALGRFRDRVTLRSYPQRAFDHSIFGLVKCLFHPLPTPAKLGPVLTAYLLTAALLGLVLFVVRIRKLPIVNQVALLTIVSIWLPPTSFDYTLVHIYAPWALFLFLACRLPDARSAALQVVFVCFAVLVSPETEIIFHGMPYGGQIKCLALGVLFLCLLLHQFHSPEDGLLRPA